MPIYEYDCGGCGRRVSLFFPSFGAVETRTAAGENKCPRCGSANLTRRMSRVRALRHTAAFGGGAGGGGGDDEDMPDEMAGMAAGLEGLDEEDPRAVARWARQMKESMGDEMDMGPEFDRALDRIEAGEDPDRVMEDLDPKAMGGGMGTGDDEALDDADFDEV